MNLLRRGMIFATFFGACAALALLVAALGTKSWVSARARRTSNPRESDGRIQFGLFEGRKELNVAYGWRTYDFDVISTMQDDDDWIDRSLWIACVTCVGVGVISAVLSAIFAVINTATTPIGCITGVPGLYVWNTFGLLTNLAAVGLWIAQYYVKLQYNVMTKEDKANMWTSNGMAEFGYSFWFIVGSSMIFFVNLLVIYIGTSEAREIEPIIPVIEEKTNGAIMLY